MWRILTTGFVLLGLAQGLAVAEMFSCERADGTIVYTDDPGQAPQDCKGKKVQEMPRINIVPAQQPAPSRQPAQNLPEQATKGGDNSKETGRSVESFENKAASLAEQFETTRTTLYRSILAKDKQKARRGLSQIRSEKSLFLDELDKSELTRSQKAGITETLSAIH